jgi:type VI secretion system protein ImpM
MSAAGFFGKMPGHGDFVERNLPRAFVDPWDAWLQADLLSGREQRQEDWLQDYLVAPVWRFAISAGCISDGAWLGVVMPSVDSVGRYFPMTFAAALPEDACVPASFFSSSQALLQMESLGHQVLDQPTSAGQLEESLLSCSISAQLLPESVVQSSTEESCRIAYSPPNLLPETALVIQVLLYSHYKDHYCLWHCQGSDRVAPGLLVTAGMPDPAMQPGFLLGERSEPLAGITSE